jgi:hypothetical protein
MTAKPREITILQTYSLDELLDLIKIKTKMEAEQQLQDARQLVNQLIKTMGNTSITSSIAKKSSSSNKGRKRGRPKKAATQIPDPEVAETKNTKNSRKKLSLGKYIQKVIGSTPMSIKEITAALKAKGYRTNSKDPKRILYSELKKQVDNNVIQKVDRGMYVKA